jgi:hypothetical protein
MSPTSTREWRARSCICEGFARSASEKRARCANAGPLSFRAGSRPRRSRGKPVNARTHRHTGRWEAGRGLESPGRRDAMPQGPGQTGIRPDREAAKKNAGRKARQLFDFATVGGAITFQRGTAGRIRRRWEEVATKQTNSLLLICSAQRAYARSSLASLLCKKRTSARRLPVHCPAKLSSCLRTRRIARPCAIRAGDAEGVGRSGAAASAAVLPGRGRQDAPIPPVCDAASVAAGVPAMHAVSGISAAGAAGR